MNGYQKLLTGRELLKALWPNGGGRSLRWLRYQVRDGALPSVKVGTARMFDAAKCRKAIRRKSAGA